MVFQSAAFLIFLFAFAALFSLTKKSPWVLLTGSIVFYLTVAPKYLVVLAAVTVAAWGLGLAIGRAADEKQKMRRTAAGVIGFLLLLALFKYAFLRALVLGLVVPSGLLAGVVLPVGMSYYLFKVIGYLVDVYWEKYEPEKSLVAFASYVSFFPQIVSGPIQRPADFLGQLRATEVTGAMWRSGLKRLFFGLFVKLVVTAYLGELVDPVYSAPKGKSAVVVLIAFYLFALQLYADFSAVTSIAIGAGKLFGITGPENFDAPFLAPNLPDFWRRWHMSLTSWLTDYVYTPVRHLLRERGDLGLAVALMANMVAVGVWHGERLTYLMFGVVNGVMMSAAALTQKRRNRFFRSRPRLAKARSYYGPVVTFHIIVFAFVFFRAATLGDAGALLGQLAGGLGSSILHPGTVKIGQIVRDVRAMGFTVSHGVPLVIGLVMMAVGHHLLRAPAAKERFLALPWYGRWAAYYAAVVLILVSGRFDVDSFIYAQF